MGEKSKQTASSAATRAPPEEDDHECQDRQAFLGRHPPRRSGDLTSVDGPLPKKKKTESVDMLPGVPSRHYYATASRVAHRPVPTGNTRETDRAACRRLAVNQPLGVPGRRQRSAALDEHPENRKPGTRPPLGGIGDGVRGVSSDPPPVLLSHR